MSPPSQYQARRLLELVSHNKARISDKDYIDHDVWARSNPPVRGLNFRDRATARCCLRAGSLGAVPSNPPELPDVQSRALPPVPANHHNQQSIPRVESNQSKLTVSSVPSFGKMREPLSGDSVNLNAHPIRPAPVTEYEEFGSEALITQVQDEIDEEFDDSTPSRLFNEIGPSISVARGIDGKARKRTTQSTFENLSTGLTDPLLEPVSQHRDDTESEEKSASSAPKSLRSATKTVTSVPSSATTLPPPPLPPLPAYALEPENGSDNKTHSTKVRAGAVSVPPPPPPLFTVESYGSTPAVPPPPSSPPPTGDDKHARRDTEDSSPVTEGESYGYRGEFRDEYSDAADSSVPSMRAHWYREYAPAEKRVENDEEEMQEDEEEEEDSFGAEEVGSIEEEEYERVVQIGINRNSVGRRREGLVG